jgi:membrane protease YdiL (CAAX protease family)
MTKTGAADPPSTRALVANQTIGLLAIVALVLALVGSERIQALVSRSGTSSYVAAWVTSRSTSFRSVDIWVIPAMLALMIAWTVGVQLVVGRGQTVSHAEWRPTRRQIGVALYLILSSSVAEEAIFRGIVLPATAYYAGTLWGLAISSLLFGLVHFEKGGGVSSSQRAMVLSSGEDW